ncbi:hypothetical protein GCM10011519_23270 [Marmoricola endophyticus]|uniref:HTH merR-type domain-containing protein n=1 Tax=Marmoricola endophyticus TaxID=2040280 RepID=A0A917BMK6_9ACTN|nr:DUF433 domain-containing protein [Marmoricola endophyticus]GGF48583.1 hypothetical protein GCM10011519_23270 [Marmoricola endophyticus]
MASEEQLVMLTRPRLARIGGVSERRLDYWEKTGLVASTVDDRLSGSRRIRLYDFTDAMTAMVLASLRQNVSLQHVRQIVAHLRSLDFGVTEVRFALAGNRVHFQLPDGTWSDAADPGQIAISEVLDLRPLRAAVLGAGARAEEHRGQIERRRGVHGSKPVIAGTRVPVKTVQAFLERGRSAAEIIESYPALTPDDVEAVRGLASA